MKISAGNRRQLFLLGGLALVLVLALVRMRSGGSGTETSPTPAAAPGAGRLEEDKTTLRSPRSGETGKKVSPDEVPIITTRDLDSGRLRQPPGERNIFDFRPPTPPPSPTRTPAPPPPPICGQSVFVGPCPPPPPTPTPPPPEVSFKFIGTFGPKEHPIAVLTHAGETIDAREGDVIFTHFIVRKIGYESLDVGFVGRDPKETQRVGLSQ